MNRGARAYLALRGRVPTPGRSRFAVKENKYRFVLRSGVRRWINRARSRIAAKNAYKAGRGYLYGQMGKRFGVNYRHRRR